MKISVCMATYNGAPYIEEQLRSILRQLRAEDEVILVDDGSKDNTLAVVESLQDARIQIHRNERNLGVIKTFERAFGLAKGEIIFLSDQDDVWFDDKVVRFMQVFKQRPEVTMVISDAQLINSQGELFAPSYFARRGKFRSGLLANILKSKFLGCAMAFRRDMLKILLPFPNSIPMHDMWIGCINALYGKTYFIDLPLIKYRRHQNNASPDKHQNFSRMFLWRWRLICHLVSRK